MTRRTTRRLVSGLVLVLLLVPALVLAQPPRGAFGFGHGPGHGFGHGPGHGPGFGDEGMFGMLGERAADELELSEAQREEIHGILERSREACRPLMESVWTLRRSLADATLAAVIDEGTIRAIAAELATAEGDLAIQRAQARQQVRAVFTPEQQMRADELRQSFQERRELRREYLERRMQRRFGEDD